jgi:hypothetical protein
MFLFEFDVLLSPNLTTNLIQLLDPHPHQFVIKYEHEMKVKKKQYQHKRHHIYVEKLIREKPR